MDEMTVDEVQKLKCNHPGCKATAGQMFIEIESREGMLVSVVCPYRHRRYIKIKTKSNESAEKRERRIFRGTCEFPGCNGRWESKCNNRKYCDECKQRLQREAWMRAQQRSDDKRRLLNQKISDAARAM